MYKTIAETVVNSRIAACFNIVTAWWVRYSQSPTLHILKV